MHTKWYNCVLYNIHIPLTQTIAAQNEVALSYHRVRGQYFMAVVFATTIVYSSPHKA